MKHQPAMPKREERRTCVQCRTELPIALLRLLDTDPDRFTCTNQAACRKRQRQLQPKTPTPKAR